MAGEPPVQLHLLDASETATTRRGSRSRIRMKRSYSMTDTSTRNNALQFDLPPPPTGPYASDARPITILAAYASRSQ